MRVYVLIGVIVALAGTARADIYEWRDSEGVRHFTNLKEALPATDGAAPTVFLEEPPARSMTASSAPEPVEPAAPRQAQVVYDRPALEAAYAEGWRAAAEGMQRVEAASAPVTVQINGPMVAAAAPASYYPYPYAPYEPLVTTSFDRGRSRHMTLRMLLQDQFALDREGPYVFPPYGPPRLGVALQPFLPRGLPRVRPARGRVIIR